MTKPVERRAMTMEEVKLIAALRDVSFSPATMFKRVALNMMDRIDYAKLGNHPVYSMISEGEARLLQSIAWHYRRQIPDRLVPAKKPARTAA